MIVSFDAVGAKDLEYLQTLPNFQRFFEQAALCSHVNSVCPSLTYPAHTSIVTGRMPKNHGIVNNTKIQPNRKDQVTVTLLRPRYDLGNTDLYVSTNNIRLDLNYHVMFGTGKIVVSGDQSTFTVANGELDGITVEAAGGTVTLEDDCNGMKALRVTSTESAVTIRGGNIGKLILPATDTESLKNVKLSGGDFGSISFHGTGNVAITDLLEAGYAFRDNKGVFGDANGLVPYGRMFPAAASFAELEVVKCDHSAVNEAKGYCNYCGKLYEGKITGKDGTVRYVEKLRESDFADGNTVVLLCNITGSTLIPKGDCTIDLNGHSVSQISFIVQDGTLTLKGYGKISVVVLGYKEIDSTLVIEDAAYRNRVKIGVLSVNKTSNTKLTGGQFDKIERKDGRFVEELLALLLQRRLGYAGIYRGQNSTE